MQFLVQRAEFEQEADKLGLKVTESDVDRQLSTIKTQYFGKNGKCDSTCEKKFAAELKKQNLTMDQVRDDVRASVIQNKIYKKVTAGVKVSDKDINSYYKKNKPQYVQPASRDVRHILVKKKALADQHLPAAEARRELRRARQEVLDRPELEGLRRQADDLEGPPGARVRQGRLLAQAA